MFQSRCGVLCDLCTRRNDVGCMGCTNTEKPFWGGECMVKSCCESKNLNHCGECDIFPCDTISTMGVEQGFDPKPKIENCRKWAKNE